MFAFAVIAILIIYFFFNKSGSNYKVRPHDSKFFNFQDEAARYNCLNNPDTESLTEGALLEEYHLEYYVDFSGMQLKTVKSYNGEVTSIKTFSTYKISFGIDKKVKLKLIERFVKKSGVDYKYPYELEKQVVYNHENKISRIVDEDPIAKDSVMASYMEEIKKKYDETILNEFQGFEPDGKVRIFLYETYAKYCREASSISPDAKEDAYQRRWNYIKQHRVSEDVRWCFEIL